MPRESSLHKRQQNFKDNVSNPLPSVQIMLKRRQVRKQKKTAAFLVYKTRLAKLIDHKD